MLLFVEAQSLGWDSLPPSRIQMTFWLQWIQEQTKSLAGYAENYDNNFNLMRMVAAVMVVLSHSYFLTAQHGQQEPLQKLIGIDSGTLAVNIFFVISGFLVIKSYLKNRQVVAFLSARFLRIFPGLVVAVLFNVFVVGAIFTELPLRAYLGEPDLRSYILINSTLISRVVQLEYILPGVFTNNPASTAVNGSLWTLPYEVWIYVALLVGGLVGVFKSQKVTNGLFLVLLSANAAIALGLVHNPFSLLANFLRFSTFFGWGVLYYVNRDHIPVSGNISAGLIILAALGWRIPPIQSFLFPLTLSYTIFWLAYVPKGPIRHYNRLGDYSYGLYIYAFPIQQSLLALMPNTQPLLLLGMTLPITFGFAALSWHFIEQPALHAKQRLRAIKLQGREEKLTNIPDQGESTL